MSDNIISRRRILAELVGEGAIDRKVTNIIIPDGRPLPDEDYLWDYKADLPVLNRNPSKEEKEEYAYKMGEICKDVVAFHNMFGGYLVIGVSDGDWEFCQFEENFDVNDLCKKVEGSTRSIIDCKYRVLNLRDGPTGPKVGLLYIPKRPSSTAPVQFIKNAPISANGKRAFNSNDIYIRSREECKKAQTSSDFAALFNRQRMSLGTGKVEKVYLDNNLPAQDPSLVEFVGRDDQIDLLWKWMLDRFQSVKLLSGAGGVGKTTLAYAFAEQLAESAPSNLERIIWLTAKKRTYTAVLGKYVDIAHTRFWDVESLLVAVLEELGADDEFLSEERSRDELIHETIRYLTEFPCLLVVDDIDSLEAEDQYDLFRTISMIFDRSVAAGAARARALLTARLSLGAAPGQLMTVTGLPIEDFTRYVGNLADSVGVSFVSDTGGVPTKDVVKLHVASSGSPLFAAAIIRLMRLGEPLRAAIEQYKGAQGVEVRRFAFERELDQLTDRQLRVLFAAVILKDCTLSKLVDGTMSNRLSVQDDIGTLRDFHLMTISASGDGFAKAEGKITVAPEIKSMMDIIRKKLPDPSKIEKECAKINKDAESGERDVSDLIHAVVQFWREDDPNNALEAAEYAVKKLKGNGDLWCLLGRAYLLVQPPDSKKADAALRKAHELGSSRPELQNLRVEAKQLLEDWVGIVEIFEDQGSLPRRSEDVYALAHAYSRIAEMESASGSLAAAETTFLKAAQLISDAFDEHRAHGMVEPLKELKHDLVVEYFSSVRRRMGRDDQAIEIWDALLKARSLMVFHRGMTTHGVQALADWCRAARLRGSKHQNTLERMETAEFRLTKLIRSLSQNGPHWSAVTELAERAAGTVATEREKYKASFD